MPVYLAYANSKQLILESWQNEIRSKVNTFPLIFGLMATYPMINLEKYIQYFKMFVHSWNQ